MTVYERAGTSNLVRPADVTGFSKACGATRRGSSKVLNALRSLPVRTVEFSNFPGDLSCQLISTTCGFVRSRLRMKTDTLPFSGLRVPATSRYATVPISETSYVGDSTNIFSTLPWAHCNAQL